MRELEPLAVALVEGMGVGVTVVLLDPVPVPVELDVCVRVALGVCVPEALDEPVPDPVELGVCVRAALGVGVPVKLKDGVRVALDVGGAPVPLGVGGPVVLAVLVDVLLRAALLEPVLVAVELLVPVCELETEANGLASPAATGTSQQSAGHCICGQ